MLCHFISEVFHALAKALLCALTLVCPRACVPVDGWDTKKAQGKKSKGVKKKKLAKLQQRCIVLIDECAFPSGRIEMCSYIYIFYFIFS